MVDAELSYFRVTKEEADFSEDRVIPLTNSFHGFRFRERLTTPVNTGVPGPKTRLYDMYAGTIDAAMGDATVGVDILTIESDGGDTDTIINNAVIPRYGTPRGTQAIPIDLVNDRVQYNLFLVSSGTPMGFGSVSVLIRRLDQNFDADDVNQVIAEIANAGAFFGYDIVQRQIKNTNEIVYDLIAVYLPV